MQVEYEQVCEHWRKGSDLIFEVSKLYMYFQFGVGAAVTFISTNAPFQLTTTFGCGLKVNIPILALSAIGFLAGIGAIFIAQTFYRYADVTMARARAIEAATGWRLMTNLYEGAWSYKTWFGASRVARILFAFIGFSWLVSGYNSFENVALCFH